MATGTLEKKSAIPEGTISIGAGMGIGAITAYISVILINKAVGGDSAYAGFGAFWSLIFVVGPGLFLPLEQEIARAVSHRLAQKDGAKPFLKLAFSIAIVIALIVGAIFAAFSPVFINHVFHNNGKLQIGFIIGIISFAFLHCSRGIFSGNHKFNSYGASLAVEGSIRFVIVLALSLMGVKDVGTYGIVMGLTPLLAVIPFIWTINKLSTKGTPASKRELGTALSFLVTSSILSQALAYSPLFITSVIEGENGTTSRFFTNAFFIARIPVIGFMAIAAALLPKLSSYHSKGEHTEFRTRFRKLFLLVIALCFIGIGGIALFGSALGKILFGEEKFGLNTSHFIVLAIGSCIFLLAQTLTSACIALQHYKAISIAYIAGFITLVITCLIFVNTEIATTLWVSYTISIASLVTMLILYFTYEKTIRNHMEFENMKDESISEFTLGNPI
jgi:O-antigen/teichoic acid export membrane protein